MAHEVHSSVVAPQVVHEGPQGSQVTARGEGLLLYRPGAHDEHDVAPPLHVAHPASHRVHVMPGPGSESNQPAAHSVHVVALSLHAAHFTSQALQVTAPNKGSTA